MYQRAGVFLQIRPHMAPNMHWESGLRTGRYSAPFPPPWQAWASGRPVGGCGLRDLCPRVEAWGAGPVLCWRASPSKEASWELGPVLCGAGPGDNCSKATEAAKDTARSAGQLGRLSRLGQ